MRTNKISKITDHKKIGQIQELFVISQEVGSGFPIFLPNGLILRDQILNYIVEEKKKRGYQFVWTPHIAKSDIYKKSGHWKKYDAMFNPMELDDEAYVLKPMNCPHHFQVYLARPRSYRELPLRISENGTVYRYEKSGEVNGLLRVRALTIDDTHDFVREDQIADEIDNVLELIEEVYHSFGFKKYNAQVSVRDIKNRSKYLGSEEIWEKSEKALINAVKKRKIQYIIEEGEAAFYGPKIDFMVKDSLGREWQLSTCQLDFNQPENFDIKYINEAGKNERPAILHTAFLGSVERFMGILIEHFAGAFPVWLSPVQVKVLPITEKNTKYASHIYSILNTEDIKAELDDRNETLQAKIRDAQIQKIPYMIIIGDKEEDSQNLSLRTRNGESTNSVKLEAFIKEIKEKIEKKTIS
ncbi:threonine--tRNA ligase [Candidatus Woesebacteria bacterium GWB1_43_5]|uniref:Threonine--tRNA ligase n=1 Tax=Candidatus Woesebacteria bacterium GWB1_43_5 TaxID=1802474 RepID=A0A1F7WR34_9BACT|nr:MAG: threonine--tRNA ligase [Candidatus Woesebacteria bacterium GWB1_43_5]